MSKAQSRLSDQNIGIDWLRSCIEELTDSEFVVEYVPERRPSPMSFIGSEGSPACYHVTFKGAEQWLGFTPARVALQDEQHVRARVLKVVPTRKEEPEPEPTIQ